MLALLTAGASAAAAIVYLAHKGNVRANWFAICQQFNNFCERTSGSLIGSFASVVVFVLLIFLSSSALGRRWMVLLVLVYFLVCACFGYWSYAWSYVYVLFCYSTWVMELLCFTSFLKTKNRGIQSLKKYIYTWRIVNFWVLKFVGAVIMDKLLYGARFWLNSNPSCKKQ
jgi:phosphoglycerol transferase MdoB-like AlkP superfamily enzyme